MADDEYRVTQSFYGPVDSVQTIGVGLDWTKVTPSAVLTMLTQLVAQQRILEDEKRTLLEELPFTVS